MGAKNWRKEEIEYLEEKWGTVSVSAIAKKLNRTENAIRIKSQKLKLGDFIQAGELISLCQLITALGLFNSYSWIRKKYVDNGLPTITKKNKKQTVMKVDLDEFWKWAENHKQILNFARFEKGNLGAEPSWVDEKRKADLLNPSKINSNRYWTKNDDSLLIQKTKSCRYTYKDLANEFNRTEGAIKRRLKDLDVPYRPVPLDTHDKWTDDENNMMIELYKKGYDACAIARTLNKSYLSIPDRLKARGCF